MSRVFNFEARKEDVIAAFKRHEIEADLRQQSPPQHLQMKYGDVEVQLGNVLTPSEVQNQPLVKWSAESGAYHLLVMLDPDEFNREEHVLRSFRHWMVGNIPGDRVEEGQVLAAFIGSGPPRDSGLHRYVFLVYRQPEKLEFREKSVHRTAPLKDRAPFCIQTFVEKYGLGDPVAGNFYQAQWDESVEPLLATLEPN